MIYRTNQICGTQLTENKLYQLEVATIMLCHLVFALILLVSLPRDQLK